MKGMVFTTFLEMVDEQFSPEVTETIIEAAELPSGGAYTAVGTYHHLEMVRLVSELERVTGKTGSELLKAFGEYLFAKLARGYPTFFVDARDAFSFLDGIERTIHTEVRKLYPDAELPSFQCAYPDGDTQCLTYRSARCFGDLAEGMIAGCIQHFGERIAVEREDLTSEGSHVQFTLRRQK